MLVYKSMKTQSEKFALYLYGLLLGDGIFSNGKGHRTDRVGYSSADLDIVNWINDNIIDYDITNPKMNNNQNRNIIVKLNSYSKTFPVEWSEYFKYYGLLALKKDKTIINVKKQEYRYILLGLFDADGCISWGKRKDRERISGSVSFKHPSIKLLEQVQKFLAEQLLIISTVKPVKDEQCFVLAFSKPDDMLRFCEFIYSDEEVVILKRKYKSYVEFKKEIFKLRSVGLQFPIDFIMSTEYKTLLTMANSKHMYIIDGVEYPSLYIACKKVDIDVKTLHNRCQQGNKGCGHRPKTTSEIEEFKKYIDKLIRKSYSNWCKIHY